MDTRISGRSVRMRIENYGGCTVLGRAQSHRYQPGWEALMASRPQAPAPFVAPQSGDLNQRFSLVAAAINRKADQTATPSFSSVVLRAPDGSNWVVSVDVSGALVTAQVVP